MPFQGSLPDFLQIRRKNINQHLPFLSFFFSFVSFSSSTRSSSPVSSSTDFSVVAFFFGLGVETMILGFGEGNFMGLVLLDFPIEDF